MLSNKTVEPIGYPRAPLRYRPCVAERLTSSLFCRVKLGMARLRKYIVACVMATIFAVFHIVTIVSTLIGTGGSGEGQAFAVLILDFPLVLILETFPGGGYILYSSTTAYVIFFSLFGTLMYAVVGGMIGYMIDKIQSRQKDST